MATNPPAIFIDRRKTPQGQSIPNRQRLLNRIKKQIRATKAAVATSGVTTGQSMNPIAVAHDVLHEPSFHYASGTGHYTTVLVGNKYEVDDLIPIDGGGGGRGSGKAGQGPNGEDDYIINITQAEYLKVLFEDCELPNLQHTSKKRMAEWQPQRAGFQRNGPAGTLNVIRSYKNAFPRRMALSRIDQLRVDELKQIVAQFELTGALDPEFDNIEQVTAEIQRLEGKIKRIPFFEQMDLRYVHKERKEVKNADAALFLIMDISGSMDQAKKELGRRYMAMQYAFIKQKYPNTDLVFIAHTEEAMEMTEEEFFGTRINGGTKISPAYEMASEIADSRYNASTTNIYITHVTDSDNWEEDNQEAASLLRDLVAKSRHFCYAHVGKLYGDGYGFFGTMQSINNEDPSGTAIAKLQDNDDVFSEFFRIYAKK